MEQGQGKWAAEIDGVKIVVDGVPDVTYDEARAYIQILKQDMSKQEHLSQIIISPKEGGDVQLDYTIIPEKFQRIRRITGYLVGSVDRWNNAKRAEEHDRVKHAIETRLQ